MRDDTWSVSLISALSEGICKQRKQGLLGKIRTFKNVAQNKRVGSIMRCTAVTEKQPSMFILERRDVPYGFEYYVFSYDKTLIHWTLVITNITEPEMLNFNYAD